MTDPKGIFTCGKGALLPTDERARAIVDKLKVGQKVLMEVDCARYPEHHRLAFAVFQKIADATGYPVEAVILDLKRFTGYADYVMTPSGKTFLCPRSLKFSAMNQDRFQQWWNDALEVIKERILPDLPQREFEEIRSIIVGRAEVA